MKTTNPPGKGFRQCVGIDVSKDKFTACMCMQTPGDFASFTESIDFCNKKTGFNQLVKWARREAYKDYPILFLMEPTGTYYEDLANHLAKLQFTIYIPQPQRVRAFFESEGIKTKTDAIDAWGLSLMGCAKPNMRPWTPPSPTYKELRQITRTNVEFTKIQTMLLNQKEALIHSYDPSKEALKSIEAMLRSVGHRIDCNNQYLRQSVKNNPEIAEQVGYIESIKGIGFLTAVTIIAETDGFAHITNRKQLASFAGLDVVAKDSGTITPKRKISKHGNSYLRRILYNCTIMAAIHNPQMRALYKRIAQAKPNKVARTAVMRKLLLLAFTLCKTKTNYDPEKMK